MKIGSLMANLTGIQEAIGKLLHKEDTTGHRDIGNVPVMARFGCRVVGKTVTKTKEGIK
jgi:hypothetical protein